MSTETVNVTTVATTPTTTVPSSTGPVRICSETGLALVQYPAMGTQRVFKKAYGPLKGRPRTSPDPDEWNRFDLPDQATLYSSTSRCGSYAEVLAPMRPKIAELAALAADVFDDVAPGSNPIYDEWCERGYMYPGSLPRIWHIERAVAQLHVETNGWYVDVEHPISLQVIRTEFAGLLDAADIPDMDVSVIRGHNRIVTCTIAEWINSIYLDDGTIPLGIRYNSRHGTDWECWATFPETKVSAASELAIDPTTDDDLRYITKLFNLHFH